MGAVPWSSCENERDLLSPHHPPSASECLSLAWLGAKGNCLTSLQFLNLSLALGRWIPKPVLSIGWYRSCWHTSFAPCTKSSRSTSPGEVAAAWKIENFLFFPPFSSSVFVGFVFFFPGICRCHSSSHLTPDYFWTSNFDSGHCKIQMVFPVWGKSSSA